MTLLTPILCYQGIRYLILLRVLEGIFGGLSFPSINAVWSKWSPPLERSRVSGIGISGCFAGTVISMLVSGFLAVNFGWESIFYVFGAIGVVWWVLWFVIVKECPGDDKKIRDCEKFYIQNSLVKQGQVNVVNPPWKAILTSMPVSFGIEICYKS